MLGSTVDIKWEEQFVKWTTCILHFQVIGNVIQCQNADSSLNP